MKKQTFNLKTETAIYNANSNLASNLACDSLIFDNSNVEVIKHLQKEDLSSLTTPQNLNEANDNFLPQLPTDPTAIALFIPTEERALELKKQKLATLMLTPEKYLEALKNTQEHAALLLKAELRLGEMLRSIKTRRGIRKDLTDNQYKSIKEKIDQHNKTKKDRIINDFKLTLSQARYLQELTAQSVEAAIAFAQKNNEIPTRALALRLKKASDLKENVIKGNSQRGIYATEDMQASLKEKRDPINYTVLFACAGTGEAHLEKNGFVAKVANEFLPERAKLYKELHPNCNMVVGDINHYVEKLVKLHKENNCQLVMASPPCQTFSKAGSRNFSNPKTNLFIPTLKFIKEADPYWVVIENVPEFLTAKPSGLKHILGEGKSIGDYIVKQLEDMGYFVNVDIQNGADYGTAQSRERSIILACKGELWEFPKKDKYRKPLFEVIGDLPSLEAGEQGYDEKGNPIRFHKAPPMAKCQIDLMAKIPSGASVFDYSNLKPLNPDGSISSQNKKDTFRRKDWGRPSNTITTETDSLGGFRTCHPGRQKSDGTYSDARVLTILELMRITGLPDDYHFPEWVEKKDKLLRDIIGECFLPNHVLRLMTTMPKKAAEKNLAKSA